jgi:integrase
MWSGAGHQSRSDESPCQFTFRFFGVLFSLSIHYSCRGRALRAVGTHVLHPLLKRLGIPKAGLHVFRHSRVTMLRKNGTPEDLQKQWIGHSSLRTTDRYSHTHQELEYRRLAASKAGLNLAVHLGALVIFISLINALVALLLRSVAVGCFGTDAEMLS